jgi:hypothetical protein
VQTVAAHLAGDTTLELVRFVLREATWDAFVAAVEALPAVGAVPAVRALDAGG